MQDVEDVDAVLAEAEASWVFGLSSGEMITSEAARTLPRITRAAVYEPPFYAESVPYPRIEWFNAKVEAADRSSALAGLTRRGLLGGVGPVAAAIAALTPAAVAALPSFGGGAIGMLAASNPDGDIGELLIRWRHAILAIDAASNANDDAALDRGVDAARAIELALLAIPVRTIEGLAVKTYVSLHHELGGTFADPFAIEFGGGMMVDDGQHRCLVADCLRLSPLLSAAVRYHV